MVTPSTTTALVPVSATVDIQVLKLYKQINAPHKTPPTQSIIAAIRAYIADLSIENAILILYTFKYGRTQLCLGRNKWVPKDLLNKKYFPNLSSTQAAQTPIFWFYGGPPTNLKWWKGTLQTVVEDRVLCEMNENGPLKTARALGVDVEVEEVWFV